MQTNGAFGFAQIARNGTSPNVKCTLVRLSSQFSVTDFDCTPSKISASLSNRCSVIVSVSLFSKIKSFSPVMTESWSMRSLISVSGFSNTSLSPTAQLKAGCAPSEKYIVQSLVFFTVCVTVRRLPSSEKVIYSS